MIKRRNTVNCGKDHLNYQEHLDYVLQDAALMTMNYMQDILTPETLAKKVTGYDPNMANPYPNDVTSSQLYKKAVRALMDYNKYRFLYNANDDVNSSRRLNSSTEDLYEGAVTVDTYEYDLERFIHNPEELAGHIQDYYLDSDVDIYNLTVGENKTNVYFEINPDSDWTVDLVARRIRGALSVIGSGNFER